MTDPAATPFDPSLPSGYELVRPLAERPDVRVVEALRGGRRVVVRLEAAADGDEARAELAVLARVEHPGLARLVDHGALPGGGRFVAREWVDGVELHALAGEREPEELGRIVVRLAFVLEHLHRRGFVHGDLKATNVLVREGDLPVLVDFGLTVAARQASSATGVSGTLMGLAPEVLVGDPPDARADLFALGVLLHHLLVPRPVDVRAFYGRFPAEPYFDALGADPAELPDFARDIVTSLVERDPSRRPVSAEHVGLVLARRLSFHPDRGAGTRTPKLEWPASRGREAFLAAALAGPAESRWWVCADDDEARGLARDASLAAAFEGLAVRGVRLGEELADLQTTLDLDRWALTVADEADGCMTFLSDLDGSPWALRAVGALRQALDQQCRRTGRPYSLVVCASFVPPSGGGAWEEREVPPIAEEEIHTGLGELLEGSADGDERLEDLAARLHAESGGSTTLLSTLLAELCASGWIQAGDERPRLRPGPLPDWVGRTRGGTVRAAWPDLASDARRVVAVLSVLGRRARIEDVVALAELDEVRVVDSIAELVDARLARVAPLGDGTRAIECLGSVGTPASVGLDDAEWRALHRAAADRIARAEPGSPRRWPHVLVADPGPRADRTIADEAQDLLDRGRTELVLQWLSETQERAHRAGAALGPRSTGQLALAWSALGELERAELEAAPLRSLADPEARAVVERVDGQLATQRHRYEDALSHFERAVELDPERRADVWMARARLLDATGRDDELDALAAELLARESDDLPRSVSVNVRSRAALSALRRGDVDRARAGLVASVDEARELGDPLREAVERTNLATVERRSGRLEAAVAGFEHALELYRDAGYQPGIALARTLLGGALRESGNPARAEAPLVAALEARERMGDAVGATTVRGTLGLLYAERGRLLAAHAELARSAGEKRAVGDGAVAEWFEASAIECAARMGRPVDLAAVSTEHAERDPRILLALARAAYCTGDAERGNTWTARAAELAASLGRTAAAADAASISALVAGNPLDATSIADAPATAHEEARVLGHLADGDRLDARTAFDVACSLGERGRDDRAARLAIAVAVRAEDSELRDEARRLANDHLESCLAGLSESETESARSTLLGVPDPWPGDLVAFLRDEVWDMDVLSVLDINRRLVEQQDLPTLLGAIVENAIEVTGAERGFLVLEEEGELSLDLAKDSRRGDIDEPEVEVSHSILRHVLDHDSPMRLSNAGDDPWVGEAPSVASLELRSILCHPFDVQEGVRGVIYLDNRLREGAFAERAERLLGLLAGQAALAIRQVRRLEEIRRLNDELNQEVAHKETDLRAARRALVDSGVTVPIGGLVGSSEPMRRVHDLLHRVAPSKLPVLVIGASGTGKELAARAVHDLSPWKSGPFVSESCAALPATLIESELFGFRKGAFTGAERDQPGLFERAVGGTLFLDEVGELPLELQAKLLRVLETHKVRRLGDAEERDVDFRLVAATNRDLATAAEAGEFRPDLFYRLDGVMVEMPPLTGRRDDVPELVDHFLRLEQAKTGVARSCSTDVMRRLVERDWPGNVRELANEIARMCVLSEGDLVDPELVRAAGGGREDRSRSAVRSIAELERQAIEDALDRTGGDKRRAAELLGISRAKIYQRLKEWRVENVG